MAESKANNCDATAAPDSVPLPAATPQEPLKKEDIVTHEILDSIMKGLDRSELEVVDFDVTEGTVAGDNFMSIMYAVKIALKNRDTGESEQLPIMLKVLPKNELRLKMIRDANIFVRDVNMYAKIIPDMERFLADTGEPQEEITRPWPKCYACKTDGESDFLAMEDLKASGFKMANRKDGLDYDHCKLLLESMARFHAVSYGMFQGEFDKILQKYPWLEELMFKDDAMPDVFKDMTKHTFNQLAVMLRENGEDVGASLVEKVYSDDYFKDMFKLVGDKARWAVIGHGDCWTNNFLFRYDQETMKPIEVKFVDYQISRAASRGVDIHYFMYSSPQIPILNEKEDELLQIYFNEFTKSAKKLGVDVDSQELTRDNFTEELDVYRYYGVVTGMMLAMITSAESSDVPDMEAISEKDFEKDEGKNFLLNMMKEKAIQKVKNIAGRHLPRCPEMKPYL